MLAVFLALQVRREHTEWLLLENQEDGVNQLNVLGEVVKLVILLACAQYARGYFGITRT